MNKGKGKRHAPLKSGDPESKRIQLAGGEATRAKWARIRELREAAAAIAGLPCPTSKAGHTNAVAAVLAMFRAAQAGDSRAFRVLAEVLGEMEQKISVREIPKLVDDIA